MSYYFSKSVNMRFDDAVTSTKEALKRHSFRVLTEINMKDNFKKGLNIDFRPGPDGRWLIAHFRTERLECVPWNDAEDTGEAA